MSPPSGRDGYFYTPGVSSPLNPLAADRTTQPQQRGPRSGRPARAMGTPLSPTQRLLRKKARVAWRCEILRHAARSVDPDVKPAASAKPSSHSDEANLVEFSIGMPSSSEYTSPGGDFGLVARYGEKRPLLPERGGHVLRVDLSKALDACMQARPTSSILPSRHASSWTFRRFFTCFGCFCLLAALSLLRPHPVLKRYAGA